MVSIENSLFVGNSAPSAGAIFVDLGPGSTVYLTNNTITGNTCTNSECAITAIGDPAGALSGFVSNTISYGNTSTYDFFLYFNGSVEFTNNDYGSSKGAPGAGSSGNLIGVDPKFAGVDDYHLNSNSSRHPGACRRRTSKATRAASPAMSTLVLTKRST
jgi:hypothetical protein